MYQKAQKLGKRTTKITRTFEINSTDLDKPLGFGKNIYNPYMTRKIAQNILQLKQKKN